MTTKSRTLSMKQRGLTNFESLMWIFTRLSALAMYALIIFAMVGALVMGARKQMNFADVMRWAFMPNVTHVQSTDVPDLNPWASPFWKLTASALLLVAVAHGVHGLVVIADDYITTEGGRRFVRLLSILFMTAMSLMGLYIIWTS
jgi:succinate dehydrogenase hydrophobic anchor subunit